MVSKVSERRRCRKLLAHEQHRRFGSQEQQRCECTMPTRRCERVRTQPGRRVRDLVVVLQELHKMRRGTSAGGATAIQTLPRVPLSLVQMPVPNRRNQLLRTARIVAVIRFGMAGRGDAGRMMKVVVPNAVRPPAAPIGRPRLMTTVPFVFTDNNNRS